MRAIRIFETGGPEKMSVDEIPIPDPGQGQVRVKIAAAGVNFIDIYQRSGQYTGKLPFTLGMEGSGIVDAVGPDVDVVKVGQRVAYAMSLGSYAEYAIVPAMVLVPVPDAIDLNVAAAIMLQGMTAHYLTHSTFPLKAGDTALIHAAAGGVGLLLIQIAKQIGARVIGTVSTEEKAELARNAGADDVILYTTEDFVDSVKRFTGGRGVDVVYDSVGRTTFDGSLQCLRRRGYLVLFGQSSGAVPPVDLQVLNAHGSLFVTRPTLGDYIATREELITRSDYLFALIKAGKLNVRIDSTYPLADAVAAHIALTSRATKGKVLLIP